MARDIVVLAILVVAFAALLTAHVTLVVGLARRHRPRWHALAALVVAPLAPWWGMREHMRARAVTWLAAAACYAVMLAMASR